MICKYHQQLYNMVLIHTLHSQSSNPFSNPFQPLSIPFQTLFNLSFLTSFNFKTPVSILPYSNPSSLTIPSPSPILKPPFPPPLFPYHLSSPPSPTPLHHHPSPITPPPSPFHHHPSPPPFPYHPSSTTPSQESLSGGCLFIRLRPHRLPWRHPC